MAIIKNTSERRERACAKRKALLAFLRGELYTIPATVCQLWGVQERGTRATLKSMEADGLIKRHKLLIAPGIPPQIVVGITQHGQQMAFNPSTETPINRSFEPGRYSLTQLGHRLDIQYLRIQAEATCRISRWIPGHMLEFSKKGVKRPDAIAIDFAGKRAALECERTLKSIQRYTAILEQHLTAIHQNKWQRVIWACPILTEKDSGGRIASAARLEKIIKSIGHCKIAGVDTLITEAHHKCLVFCDYKSFENHL